MPQQTAVEWFAKEILSYKNPTNISGTDYILIPINKVDFLETKAKQMEKDQVEISDEEIEQEAHIQYPVNLQPNGRTLSGGRYDIDINYLERNAYILSAKWMRDKIQNK